MDPHPRAAARLACLLAMALAVPVPAAPTEGAGADGADPAEASAEARGGDELALRRIKTQVWPDLYRRQDVDGLAGLLADGFVNIAPDGAITTRVEELAWVRDNEWKPVDFAYVVDRIVWQGRDLVLVVGRGQSTRTDPQAQSCRHSYVSSNLLRRAPDSALGWQALSSHVSGVECQPMPGR